MVDQTANTPTGRTRRPASLARQNEQLKKNLRKPLASTRVALRQEITLKFPNFQGFLTEYSSNLSMTGMFVRSDHPKPAGTLVAFEFILPDKVKLIRGQAEVVWRRLKNEGPDRPPGMGLRFVRLDAESRRLIRWTVEKRVLEGGSLVELEDLMGAGKQGLNGRDVDLRKLYPYAGAARAKSARRRYGEWAGAALLAALLIGGFLYARRQGGGSPAAHAVAGAEQGVAAEPEAAAGEPAAGQLGARQPGARQPAPEEISAAVAAWAAAWSEQRVDDYLSRYSPDFRHPAAMSRAEWEELRRSRISQPRRIRLETADLAAEVLSPERARVSFLQRYESDTYRDTVRKILILALESGQWRILDERSEEVP